MMIWINFGFWSGSSGRFFRMERIYREYGRWTPFVWVSKRYESFLGEDSDGPV